MVPSPPSRMPPPWSSLKTPRSFANSSISKRKSISPHHKSAPVSSRFNTRMSQRLPPPFPSFFLPNNPLKAPLASSGRTRMPRRACRLAPYRSPAVIHRVAAVPRPLPSRSSQIPAPTAFLRWAAQLIYSSSRALSVSLMWKPARKTSSGVSCVS